ncbi:MAG: D-tyrosyl-tRNA(Tyr) deacylase [Propionibacteriaceae bacterium]|jgi:D-tyrosyl-tRNA(Tyr) deacylase|nr:D-tyrosyl-tRNA(Tyr) deacylase [Propionibacteriaceae bacterium]
MRMVVQRASRAEVVVAGNVVGSLPRPGLVVLVGVTHGDTLAQAEKLAGKIWRLRILEPETRPGDEAGDHRSEAVSCSDIDAPLLIISQFTLYADTRKGRRPSWSAAAPGPVAEPLVDHVVETLRGFGAHVETGIFGAMMEVSLTNDGPVTLILEE